MIVGIKWLDSNGNTAGSFNHFVDYSQWSQLVQHTKSKFRTQTIDLASFNIQTRYLIVDCNFTLRPLNGAKI